MAADRTYFSTLEICGLFSSPIRIIFSVRFDMSERGIMIVV